jgi:pimeloyl-ACP methyl ester carboxylesterase
MIEKHFIEVENGEGIAAIHHEADSDKWFFICHGFGGNKERQTEYLEPLAEQGYNAVVIDFRGNGEADGEFIEQDLSSRIKDLEAAVNYFEPDETILFGTSFGGKVVFHAATELEVDAVVTKAPVTYNEIMDKFRAAVKNKGEFEYIPDKPIDQRFFDEFDKYSFDDVKESLDIPVAIFHGAADTTVHPEHSFTAAESLETDVMLQKLKGEKHSFSEDAEEQMINQMISWLNNNGF